MSSGKVIKKYPEKKYKCKYCEQRIARSKFTDHIERFHRDIITDEFPAERLAFYCVNNKISGRCTICGNESQWNKGNMRYDRFCSEKCRSEYVKMAKDRMRNKYGKEHLLDDVEHQKRMLSNRSITKTYTFRNGAKFEYVGSYEGKLLEFEEKVLELDPKDIMMPGPVIEYYFEGKKRYWITDQYIIPFNLAIDVKDGGDNPSGLDLSINRAKQVEKEKQITKDGKYNYIRLTDNQFNQLLHVMMDIKYSLASDEPDSKIIHINENTKYNIESVLNFGEGSQIGYTPVIGTDSSEVYVVPYLKNCVFADCEDFEIGYAISKDNIGMDLLTEHNDELYQIPANLLSSFKMFKIDLNTVSHDIDFKPNSIIESVLGEHIGSAMNILCDNRFEEVAPFSGIIKDFADIVKSTILSSTNKPIQIPVVEYYLENDTSKIQAFYEDNGVYMMNILNNMRTKKYPNINAIPEHIKNILKEM